MRLNSVLLSPLLTEKSAELAKRGVYSFVVNTNANKHQVADVISTLYKVTVKTVRISVRKGKEKRVGKRLIPKKLPDQKIAYIHLSEGKIDLFPQT